MDAPPDEFVQNLDILLYLCHIHGLFCVEDREWRHGSAVVDISTSRLEKSTDEKNLEQSVCILEKFERRACLDEFVCVAVKVARGDYFEVLVELITEYYETRLY